MSDRRCRMAQRLCRDQRPLRTSRSNDRRGSVHFRRPNQSASIIAGRGAVDRCQVRSKSKIARRNHSLPTSMPAQNSVDTPPARRPPRRSPRTPRRVSCWRRSSQSCVPGFVTYAAIEPVNRGEESPPEHFVSSEHPIRRPARRRVTHRALPPGAGGCSTGNAKWGLPNCGRVCGDVCEGNRRNETRSPKRNARSLLEFVHP
jgi:hypothetical protein